MHRNPSVFANTFWGALVAVALAGCADFGGIGTASAPRPVAELGAAQTLQTAAVGDWPQQQWWQRFGDPQLDALIDEALAHSPSMEDAVARLHMAQAYTGSTRAALYPHIDGALDIQYQRFSENGLYPPPLAGSFNSEDALQLNFSYDIDFWGKNRNAVKAALAIEQAATAEHENAKLVLANAVGKSYVELYRLFTLRDVIDKTLQQRQQIFTLTRQRVDSGIDSQAELKQAQSELPALRGQLAQLDEAIGATRNQIAALVGAGPDRGLHIERPKFTAPVAALLQLPANLPVDLLGRRPDVVVARWLVEASERDTDVAKSQFYPNVNLSAFAGFSSLGLDNLVHSGSEVYGGGPALRLPLFEGGRLRANLRNKYAQYESAVANYDKTLIDALRDTADQINGLKWLETRQREQQSALAIARDALDLVTQRYRAGLGNYLSVLNAETAVLAQEQLGVELAARGFGLHIDLIKALGGGYDAATRTAQAAVPTATSSQR
jgi:NodT family efflux transporter outer membrane factor (OMF) lipoprotein